MRKRTRSEGLQAKPAARPDRNSSQWLQRLAEARKALGERVRKLRQDKGWSQEEFADRCGVHHSWISKIENGKANLRISTIQNLAGQFDIRISDLMKGVA